MGLKKGIKKALVLALLSTSLISCFHKTNTDYTDIEKGRKPDEVVKKPRTKLDYRLTTFGRYLSYIIWNINLGRKNSRWYIGIHSIKNESDTPNQVIFTKGVILTASNKLFSSAIGEKYIKFVDMSVETTRDEIPIRPLVVPANIHWYIDTQIAGIETLRRKTLDISADISVGGGLSEMQSGSSLPKEDIDYYYTLTMQIKDNKNTLLSTGITAVVVPKKSSGFSFSLYFYKQGLNFADYETVTLSKVEVLRYLVEYNLMYVFSKIYGLPYWHCLVDTNKEAVNKVDNELKFYLKENWVNKPEERSLLYKTAILSYIYYFNKEAYINNLIDEPLNIPEDKIVFMNDNDIERIVKVICEYKNIKNCKFNDFNTFWNIYNQSPFCNRPVPDKALGIAIKREIIAINEGTHSPDDYSLDKETKKYLSEFLKKD